MDRRPKQNYRRRQKRAPSVGFYPLGSLQEMLLVVTVGFKTPEGIRLASHQHHHRQHRYERADIAPWT